MTAKKNQTEAEAKRIATWRKELIRHLGEDLRAVIRYLHGGAEDLVYLIVLMRRFGESQTNINGAILYFDQLTEEKIRDRQGKNAQAAEDLIV